MKSLIVLRRRCVLWGTVMAACLLSGFILTTSRANLLFRSAAVSSVVSSVAQGSHKREQVTGNREQGQKAPDPNPESRIPNPVLAGPNPQSRIPNTGYGSAPQPRLIESYGKLPLSFEINQGQTNPTAKFLSRGRGYSLFLTGNEAVLALRKGSRQSKVEGRTGVAPAFRPADRGNADLVFRSATFPGWLRSPAAQAETSARTADPKTESALHLLPTAEQFKSSFASNPESRTPNPESQAPAVLRMKLVGANPHAKVSGLEELPGKSNYFIGNDPKKWRTKCAELCQGEIRQCVSGRGPGVLRQPGKTGIRFRSPARHGPAADCSRRRGGACPAPGVWTFE